MRPRSRPQEAFQAARESGTLPRYIDATVSELLVLGLLAQGVRTFLAVFGHGSTEVGEVLRIYQEAGLVARSTVCAVNWRPRTRRPRSVG